MDTNTHGFDSAPLTERAWNMIDMALKTGVIRTENGLIHALKPGELARLLQYLASLNTGKRKKIVSSPEDFIIPETN